MGLEAQNLVPDGSFEQKKYCPTNYNLQQLNNLKHWKQASDGTPDHYSVCSDKMGVPRNLSGVQEAKEGESYLGMILFSASKKDYREYIWTKLERPLQAGEMVCVELYVSPAETANFIVDGFGVHLGRKMLRGDRTSVIPEIPQFRNPKLHLFENTEDWTLISDIYKAEGGEEYLTIGNFLGDREMKILERTEEQGALKGNDWSYLYIDDVRITPVKSKSECSCVNEIIAMEIEDPPRQLKESRSIRFENILFEFDRSELTEESMLSLDEVALQMKRKPSLFIEVAGHADIIGDSGYNLDLSRERAEMVIGYLVGRGIEENRLMIKFFGSEKPVANNESEEGREKNRRVEFEIRQKKFMLHE